MRKIAFTWKVVVVLLLSPLYTFSQEVKVKNVILMIGDGMGVNQMYAAMTKNGGTLNIARCPFIGLSKTYSANNFTTDSGAGGTAIACGVKTNNYMIGMSPDSVAKESIMFLAHKAGLSTGLVVTCNVTNATPASFVAHQINREMLQEIAVDYLTSGIDVFIGGGRNEFEKRKDNKNLSAELIKMGYQLAYTMEDVAKVKTGKLAGLVANNNLPKANERGDMLLKGTSKALELLNQNQQGFFLMIEGSQIDWAAHYNKLDRVIDEVIDFDKTVGLVLDFAAKDGNTLVIITADHETGGLALLDKNNTSGNIKAEFTTMVHSGMPVPVYSFGPGAEKFTGFMENTSFVGKLLSLYHFSY